ncbi:MAG: site-specific DNA-methyltransferase [Phycisphaerae bacterium]|nr:site-specific DNA-methyltransferase [Phycisphaerae bacterium]
MSENTKNPHVPSRHLSGAKVPETSEAKVPAPLYFTGNAGRFTLYQGNCLELMPLLPAESFDLIFADPPYFLSNGGITCHAGKMVSVNKGKWDRSMGFAGNYAFTKDWIARCRRLLKPNGTMFVSGTSHIIHIVGAVMDELGLKILNDITWVKPNPPPNLSCRYFTHAAETILWAGRDKKCRHKFNYQLMKRINGGKQMKSVWTDIETPRRDEKVFGKHPTQKPLALLERIIAAASDEGDLILDPFSGSATTGIAAARMNRQSIGLEMETEFLDIGVHRFVGVPQADNPDRILDLVKVHASENPAPTELARCLGMTERQVYYYRQAASILGLLRRSKSGWALTEIGKTICENSQSYARSLFAQRILELPLVQSAIRKSRRYRTKSAKCRIVAELLSRSTALTGSTCNRRAQTLLAWIDWSLAGCRGRGVCGHAATDVNVVANTATTAPVSGPVKRKVGAMSTVRYIIAHHETI